MRLNNNAIDFRNELLKLRDKLRRSEEDRMQLEKEKDVYNLKASLAHNYGYNLHQLFLSNEKTSNSKYRAAKFKRTLRVDSFYKKLLPLTHTES